MILGHTLVKPKNESTWSYRKRGNMPREKTPTAENISHTSYQYH